MKERLIVEGNVQGVGYRALVKQVARKMGVKGIARNLDDGSVEIFCESDKNRLEQFRNDINIRSGPGLFSINVENIRIFPEERKGYTNPPDKFGIFEVDYGAEATAPFEKANLERLEIGTLVMSSFKDETKQSFNNLDEKYGEISERMLGVQHEMKASGEIASQQILDMSRLFKKEMKADRELTSLHIENIQTEMKEDRKVLREELRGFRKSNDTLAKTFTKILER